MIEARFPGSLRSASIAVAGLMLATAAFAGTVGAQQDAQPQGSVRAGTCAEPGDVVALLSPFQRVDPASEPQADHDTRDRDLADEGAAVLTSITQVPLAFAELTGESHIVAMDAASIDAGELCATIGGPPAEGVALASAVTSPDGRAVGVAWLSELGLEASAVHVFLLADLIATSPEPGAAPESPEPSASPDPDTSPEPSASPDPDTSPEPSASPEPSPGASPASGEGIVPEGEIDPGEDIDVDVAN